MIIIIGRTSLLPFKINKSIKLKMKIIALILFNVFSFFLNHLFSIVVRKYTKHYYLIICASKCKRSYQCGD